MSSSPRRLGPGDGTHSTAAGGRGINVGRDYNSDWYFVSIISNGINLTKKKLKCIRLNCSFPRFFSILNIFWSESCSEKAECSELFNPKFFKWIILQLYWKGYRFKEIIIFLLISSYGHILLPYMDEACVLCSSHFQHFLCDYGKTLLLCRIAEAAPLNMNTAGSGQREPPRLVLEVEETFRHGCLQS